MVWASANFSTSRRQATKATPIPPQMHPPYTPDPPSFSSPAVGSPRVLGGRRCPGYKKQGSPVVQRSSGPGNLLGGSSLAPFLGILQSATRRHGVSIGKRDMFFNIGKYLFWGVAMCMEIWPHYLPLMPYSPGLDRKWEKTLRLSPHDRQPARERLVHDGQPVYKDFQPPRPSKIQIPNGIVIPSPSSIVPFQAPDSVHLEKIRDICYVSYIVHTSRWVRKVSTMRFLKTWKCGC